MNSVFRWNTHLSADRPETSGVKVVEPSADLVDGVRTKHVGPSRDSLIGFRSLDALLEAAAVGDASEGTRNVLRIVRVTEAEEYLFLFGGVEIEPSVERVFVLVQFRARCEVVIWTRVGRVGVKVEKWDRCGINPVSGKYIQTARAGAKVGGRRSAGA